MVALLDRTPPVALVLTGVTSIQFGAALAATLFDEAGAAGVSALRLLFAAVLLLAIWRPDPRAFSASELRLVALYGLTLGAMNLTFYEALARIPLGVAVTIEFIGPLAVAVATSHRRLDLLWIGLAALGIVLLTQPGAEGSLDPVGVAFALVAAAFWGAYILLAASTGRATSGGRPLALAMGVAALVPLPFGVAVGGSGLLGTEVLVLGFAVAVLSSAIPYTLEFEALRRMPRHVFGVLMSMEPAVAALAGLVVLSQDLDALQVAAIGLVVVASAGVSRPERPSVPPTPVEG